MNDGGNRKGRPKIQLLWIPFNANQQQDKPFAVFRYHFMVILLDILNK